MTTVYVVVILEVNSLIIDIKAKSYSHVTNNFTSTNASTQCNWTYQNLSCVLLSLLLFLLTFSVIKDPTFKKKFQSIYYLFL